MLLQAPVVLAQPEELQQLDDFLNPPSPPVTPQVQPSSTVQPAPVAPSATPWENPSQPSVPSSPPAPLLPASDLPQLTVLSLNSHNPGTLGSPRQLQDGFYQDLYQFDGNSGDYVLLNLIGSDDPRMQLDPRLQLIGPDGSIVAEDDNGGYDSSRGDARIVIPLPDTGTYTIVVTTAEPDDRGRYTLGLLEVDDPSAIQ